MCKEIESERIIFRTQISYSYYSLQHGRDMNLLDYSGFDYP
jgi:hypothetical protein